MLPPNPPKNYNDSIHSSNSSEVSRNNANLPDGWIIQMSDDGKTWIYFNEYTGKTLAQHPSMDHDNDIITSQRESFASDQSNEFKTTKELMENWVERKTPQGRLYFCNLFTQETTWDFNEIDSETGLLVCYISNLNNFPTPKFVIQ